ncbi:hypothetical protein BH20ACT9_BH20ACT9_03520 [soil metagenome]
MRADRLAEMNAQALAHRPFLDWDYEPQPLSTHKSRFHEIKRRFPYFGYIDVKVEDVPPFVMFSNNDDRVAQMYFWYGPNAFESLSLQAWAHLSRRSRHIFDIGAYTGVYSLAAARANQEAEVYCFEPVKRVFGRLVDNLVVNRLGTTVKPFDVALSNLDGRATMNLFRTHRTLLSGSSLLPKSGKPIVASEDVDALRLDTFVERHGVPGVDLVKIDVEQAEQLVIEGMDDTLRRYRPTVLVEVSSADRLRELVDVLRPLGYGFAVVDDILQRFHVDDVGAHQKVCNVLFSSIPANEFGGLCAALEARLQAEPETRPRARFWRRPGHRIWKARARYDPE